MNNSISRVGVVLNRQFSKSGLPLLRVSQEEGVSQVQGNSDSWIMKSAVALTLIGTSFSLFSARQLYDDSVTKSFRKK